ncbi:MAG: hypothetical protein ABW134_15445 [Candidatus Thiodiazotropha endolucinida]
MAKNKIDFMVESAKVRIEGTTGGRIADAIRTRGAEPAATFDGKSLASPDSAEIDAEAEIAAFVGTDTEKS